MGWLHRVTPYTERKEVLEALVEREQQLATAQRIAHIGSWAWDVAADRVQWSDEMCRIFGVHPGTTPDFETYLSLLHPADREHADRGDPGGGGAQQRQLPAHLRPPAQGQRPQPGRSPASRPPRRASRRSASPVAPTRPRGCSTT